MALLVSVPDPEDAGNITAYRWFGELWFDFESGKWFYTRLTHRSAAAAAAGKPILDREKFVIPPGGLPEVKHLVGWDTPPTYAEDGSELAPGVGPQYVIDRPGIPDLMTLVGTHAEAFGALRLALYAIEKSLPENAGAVDTE